MIRARLILLGVILVLLAAAASALRLTVRERHLAVQAYEDVYYLPPPGWLPLVSLGYREALADLIWCRSLVYFGEEVVHRGTVRYVFDYTEAMLELDPEFLAVYRWVATAALYGDTELEVREVRRAVSIMERGLERFPDDGALAWDIGATLAFELPPLLDDPADDEDARREAAPYLMLATRLGAAPPWMALTNASMLRRLGEAETAARHLEEMYAVTRDEATREEILGAIAALRSQIHAAGVAEAARDEAEDRERDYPYVDPGLFPLIRARDEDDWRAVYRAGFARDLGEDALEDDLAAEP